MRAVRLHPIRTGEFLAPSQLLERVAGPFGTARALGLGTRRRDRIWIPVPAFLVEHPAEGPLMIDTGLPALAATDFARGADRTSALLYELRMTPRDGIAEQVRARGVEPADVRLVVMTHLHTDHAAGMREFPGATFAASAEEFRSADAPLPVRLLGGYHAPLYAGRPRRVLDFSGGQAWGAFRRTIDLFGDGSVRVLFTPGHTPGHCSVALQTATGPVLLTGDLAYTRSGVYADAEPGVRAKPGLWRDSVAQLRAHVRSHRDTTVIPGHDPAAWAELRTTY